MKYHSERQLGKARELGRQEVERKNLMVATPDVLSTLCVQPFPLLGKALLLTTERSQPRLMPGQSVFRALFNIHSLF